MSLYEALHCFSAPKNPAQEPIFRLPRTAGKRARSNNALWPRLGVSINCRAVANWILCCVLAPGFADAVLLLSAHKNGELPVVNTRRIDAALIFERLWRETGCQAVIEGLLKERAFEFPVERAVFMTVLHRLMVSGSDRAAEKMAAGLCHKRNRRPAVTSCIPGHGLAGGGTTGFRTARCHPVQSPLYQGSDRRRHVCLSPRSVHCVGSGFL